GGSINGQPVAIAGLAGIRKVQVLQNDVALEAANKITDESGIGAQADDGFVGADAEVLAAEVDGALDMNDARNVVLRRGGELRERGTDDGRAGAAGGGAVDIGVAVRAGGGTGQAENKSRKRASGSLHKRVTMSFH